MRNQISNKQKQRLRINPKHIDFVNILQMPSDTLEQKVNKEVVDNSFLELWQGISQVNSTPMRKDIPDHDSILENVFVEEQTLYSYLESQISSVFFIEREYDIADYIIGNLDARGYFTLPIDVALSDLKIDYGLESSESEFMNILTTLQRLDPPGVCARNMRECFMIQLQRMRKKEWIPLAYKIVNTHWDDFLAGRKKKIKAALGVSSKDLDAAFAGIKSLNPEPASLFYKEDSSRSASPDFIVRKVDGDLQVELLHSFSDKIKVRGLVGLFDGDSSKESAMLLKGRRARALDFVKMLKKREDSLLNVMRAIVDIQRKYFLSEDICDLVPMKLKDIADRLGLDISIISRIVNNKVVQTPFGTFLLRYFFSSGIENSSGERISSKFIQEEIRGVLSENHGSCITDQKITDILNARGIKIARRTVNKYRHKIDS